MQVPAQFEYERATSVEHAIALLARHGPESRVLAGGHSLIPMMKLRLAEPETLIDINDLSGLAGIEVDGDELCIGAMARHADLLAAELAGTHYPILHDAERVIADPVVRNRGTVGGSLCQADPSEDLSAAFTAIHASAVIQGADGTRVVSMREFFTGPYQTVVGAAELLVQLRVPIRAGGGSAYVKVERRVGDWPVAAVGAALWLAPAGGAGNQTSDETIADAGIGMTAVGAAHFVAAEAEDYLRGKPATAEHFAQAGRIAAAHCQPSADQRGPVDYKRHLAGELTIRALHRAMQRATAPATTRTV